MNRARVAGGSYSAAIAWQIALAVYMQAISWIPLGRWNYQPCCPPGLQQLQAHTLSATDAAPVLAFVIPPVAFWLGSRTRRTWAMWIAVAFYVVWLGLQLATWWPPYLFGASENWSRVYARAFAQSTALLPRWGNHLPPDGMHFVLQILLVGATVSSTMALVRARSSSPVQPPIGTAGTR